MTEDLLQQATADFRRAKARAEETAAAVRQAQTADAEAQAELARMQNVLDWFEQRRPQKRDEPQERTAPPERAPDGPAPREPAPVVMNLSDRVHKAVTQLGGSAKNADIYERLRQDGHEYTPLQVRGAAKHLATKGRLISGGYGIWRLPPAADPEMNGAGRVPMA